MFFLNFDDSFIYKYRDTLDECKKLYESNSGGGVEPRKPTPEYDHVFI